MRYLLVFGIGFVVIVGLFLLGEWLGGDSGPAWGYQVSLGIGVVVMVLSAILLEAARHAA